MEWNLKDYEKFIKDYGTGIYLGVIAMIFILFFVFKVVPDLNNAREQDFELYYGETTFHNWMKLNHRNDLTYQEWYILVRADYIKR